ncbi:MAG: nucleoside triphosphate pyrophosphatase [Gammaproteobacteria bacterium]|nr:nucleoside triphosphate pyrophosphatase [Gammaproteobacteria bacterium]
MLQLVLGSTSPFRSELLTKLGLPFVTDAPQIDETARDGESPDALVSRLAAAKAHDVGARHDGALVIGSDQVACVDGRILGKPGDRETAVAQLCAASGETVDFHTGLCLLNTGSGRAQVAVEPFAVDFRDLDRAQIERYVDRERPFNCAGSFKSEGLGIALFAALRGRDPNALIGLPLILLVEMLAREGVAVP